jgi:CBS domain-containing protein
MPSLVQDLMTTQVVTVTPETPFKKIVACLAEHRVTALPVVDDQGLVLGWSPRPTAPQRGVPPPRPGPPAGLDPAAPQGTGQGGRLDRRRPDDRRGGVDLW